MHQCLVIGTGSAGSRHIRALKEIGVTVHIYSIRTDRADFWKNQGYQIVDDLSKLVKGVYTHVIIASNTDLHLEHLKYVISLDAKILIEKPLSFDLESIHRFTKTLKVSRDKIFVACCLRFSKSLNAFRNEISDLGSLHSVFVRCHSYLPDWVPGRSYKETYSADKVQGGVLLDLIHEIDYTGWIFGWPEQIHGQVLQSEKLEIPVEDAAHITWKSENGHLVSIYVDYLSRFPDRGIKAYGENGWVEWDWISGTVKSRFIGAGAIKEQKYYENLDEIVFKQDKAFIMEDENYKLLATWEDGSRAMRIVDQVKAISKN
jgi:predicted dehydrogenase